MLDSAFLYSCPKEVLYKKRAVAAGLSTRKNIFLNFSQYYLAFAIVKLFFDIAVKLLRVGFKLGELLRVRVLQSNKPPEP